MTKEKKFNAAEWLQKANEENPPRPISSEGYFSTNAKVERVIQRIEASHTDITSAYNDWLNLGFAISDEFGESGRNLYHRISRFYHRYDFRECDKQFDACLKSRGHGISINTFFHIARNCGVDITHSTKSSTDSYKDQTFKDQQKTALKTESGVEPDRVQSAGASQETPIFDTPRLPASVHNRLPEFLRECCDMFSQEIEKDVVLIGSLAVISGCLPNIEGVYFDEIYTPHLFTFITAPAGSGKGRVKWARYLGNSIHKKFIEQSINQKAEYEREVEYYHSISKNQRVGMTHPVPPKRRMFYIPANCSASAFIQALADNEFCGMIFETEADTLASALKQEWGNFCDVLRKAFHHESTTMFRRKDSEHTEVLEPHLAIVLAGTPKQVHNIMPNVENGLFSRFLYYAFEDNTEFRNPFLSYKETNYTQFFKSKGERLKEFYDCLKCIQNPIQFKFNEMQASQFTVRFNELYKRNRRLLNNDFNASSRRLGLISFRIAMILTALRALEDGHLPDCLECSDTDFEIAVQIAFTLEQHAVAVYQNLPEVSIKTNRLTFLNALPVGFNRQDYLVVARDLDIKDKTAQRYIHDLVEIGCLKHEHNWYSKTPEANRVLDFDIPVIDANKQSNEQIHSVENNPQKVNGDEHQAPPN